MTTKTTTTGGRLREGREEKEEARKEGSKQGKKRREGGRANERQVWWGRGGYGNKWGESRQIHPQGTI